jgi:hypothetical protein
LTAVGFILSSPVMSELLPKIEAFLEASKMSPTAFGKEAMGDPCFVGDLRNGREVRRRIAERALQYIADRQAENGDQADAA